MSETVQTYLAGETRKAAEALEAALGRLPEDRRAWSPMGGARTALNQVAECALLTGYIAEVVRLQEWPESIDLKAYPERRNTLAQEESAALALLKQTVEEAATAIAAAPDEALAKEIQTPFGSMTLQKVAGMASWNMSYHEGQINYIGSMLG